MNLPVKGSLATTVPLVPMESEEDPSGLGFLPRLLFRGAGDLPNINRDSLLWEQRSTLRATGFCQFLSLQDWLQAFYAEIWPVLKSDPPIVWPEAPRENVASPRGKILILVHMHHPISLGSVYISLYPYLTSPYARSQGLPW